MKNSQPHAAAATVPTAPKTNESGTRLLRAIGPVVVAGLFFAALAVLHHELRQYHFHDIVADLKAIPLGWILAALGATTCGYLVLTGYDALAVRYVRHPLPFRKTAFVSLLSYAFSNNIGMGGLSGGAVRYRLYSAWGMPPAAIASVIGFCALTVWLGFLALGGLAFTIEPPVLPPQIHFASSLVRPLGVAFLVTVGLLILATILRKRPIRIRRTDIALPPVRLLVPQLLISCMDWLLAGTVLFVLLPAGAVSFPAFLAVYLLAQTIALVSNVPGGLGVFDSLILVLLSPVVPASSVVAALLVFRVTYYLLPFSVAAVSLVGYEIVLRRHWIKSTAARFGPELTGLAPNLLAFTTFAGGAILLLSGATPDAPARLEVLQDLLPLPVLEASHFLASLAGVGLLILARGIQRRLDAAYLLAAVLLSAGIVLSLLKGFDYEEAILLASMLAVLLPCRRHFYRKSSLVAQPFTPGWIAAVFVVIAGSAWLGFFSYKHVDYATELWWRFAFHGDAPRFLRASVGTVAAAMAFAAARLLRTAPPERYETSAADVEKAAAIVRDSPISSSNLALLGDKRFLFNDAGDAMIMYAVEGRSWVAMGDPVGAEEDARELVWKFRDLCHRHDDWPVFYEVRSDNLPLYLDVGLTLVKLGEAARVPLTSFSLEGSARKGLRYVYNRLEKASVEFEVVPVDGVPALIPELQAVSDRWLAEKDTREKGFSLGFFAPEYVRRFPVAVARKEGKILAFANLWPSAGNEELSIDLMRYLPGAPGHVMEYLFIRLMLWGREQGYRWFNLGMAPLSGLEDRALAPLWNKLGAFLFRHGEHFYNFQGLRAYKEKFDPVWEPVYLASPGRAALPRVLANIATLVSGGIKGVVAK